MLIDVYNISVFKLSRVEAIYRPYMCTDSLVPEELSKPTVTINSKLLKTDFSQLNAIPSHKRSAVLFNIECKDTVTSVSVIIRYFSGLHLFIT